MAKACINPDCGRQIEDDSAFCGFCRTKQEGKKDTNFSHADGNSQSEAHFFADDYEIVRQFDPVITPTKEKVSLDNLLNTIQETVNNKNYPFSVDNNKQRWRTEGDRGKPRIVIQANHDAKWQKIIFPIAVEQLGDDTTIKLSVLRKNEMAEFYYSMLEAAGGLSDANFSVEHKINWQDERKYTPILDQAVRFFAGKIEGIMAQNRPEEIKIQKKVKASLISFIDDLLITNPQYKNYWQEIITQLEKKKTLLKEIELIQTEATKVSEAIGSYDKRITFQTEGVAAVEKLQIIAAVISIIVFVMLLATLSSASLIVGGGIYLGYVMWRMSKRQGLEALQRGLQETRNKYNELNSQISQKRGEINNIENVNSNNRSLLIDTGSSIQKRRFQVAEQNELKWRVPSFVDEELEQLISVVKNLFNQITAKVTAKKEARDVKLQSSMGLGGMGFDE